MFHLAWFLGNGYGIQPWSETNGDGPWVGTNVTDWVRPDLYVDLARGLERAGFDYLLFEDTSMVEDSYGGSSEVSLRRGFFAPKNDPMPLIPLLTQATRHIGIVATASTIQYPPYLAARLFTTLDHLTEGRVGMNVVTSVSDAVARNFGYERHLDHDERYDMAMEWVEVVRRLQASWDRDALVADPERGVYADHRLVRPIDFVGRYFRSRGPLNTIPGPQGVVPICSAGSSPSGRRLAAAYDDTMISVASTVAGAKEYREDMRRRVSEAGRDPDAVKFLFITVPTIAATDADAEEAARRAAAAASSDAAIEYKLWHMSYASGGRIDFASIHPDTLVADIDLSRQNGELTSIENIFRGNEQRTLREVMSGSTGPSEFAFVGSPDTVAARMGEAMAEIGGDGFLVYLPTTRLNIALVADGLAVALRRRGLIREEYTAATLRENLTAF